MKGLLVVVEGPDGAGKSCALQGLKLWAEQNKRNVFDAREFEKQNHRIPSFTEVKDFDIIINAEPSKAGLGQTIREELIRPKEGRKYSGVSIAQAFAIDREISYKKLIIPALEAGKWIFQERSVITSFVYQPVQIHIPMTELMNLPGNRLALKYAPNLIIVCTVEPEYLAPRMKNDNQIFKHLTFLRKVHERYRSEWLQAMFSKTGSKFFFVDTTPPVSKDETIHQVTKEFDRLITKFVSQDKH